LRKAPLAILLLLILITAGTYTHFTIYLQKEKERQHQLLEQRIAPLVDAFIEEGYSNQTAREKALAFDFLHSNWTINNQYNQTVINYAILLDQFPQFSVVEKEMNAGVWTLVDFMTNLRQKRLVSEEIVDFLPKNYSKILYTSLGNKVLSFILNDNKVSPEEARALKYLSQFGGPIQREVIELGLSSETINWLNLLGSLNNQTFAEYAIRNKLCIGDGKLTSLEKNFLYNPYAYTPKLVEEYISEIRATYPQLADEWTKLPGFNNLSIQNVEVTEDLACLLLTASITEVKEALEKILTLGSNDALSEPFKIGWTMLKNERLTKGYDWNTQLLCVRWLAEQNEFHKNDTLALAIAISNGIWILAGNEEVRRNVYQDINEELNFFRETQEIQKARGWYPLSSYPLEAKVMLTDRWNFFFHHPEAQQRLKKYFLPNLFKARKINVEEYRYATIEIKTLREMREYALNHPELLDPNPVETLLKIENYFVEPRWLEEWVPPNAPFDIEILWKDFTEDYNFSCAHVGRANLINFLLKSIGIPSIGVYPLGCNLIYDPLTDTWKTCVIPWHHDETYVALNNGYWQNYSKIGRRVPKLFKKIKTKEFFEIFEKGYPSEKIKEYIFKDYSKPY